jgi:uncharacterized delta-60 repeat protein
MKGKLDKAGFRSPLGYADVLVFSLGYPFDSRACAITLQTDQKIVVVGFAQIMAGESRFLVARFDSTGTLDPTFGTGGLVLENFGALANSHAFAVAIQPDGMIVVAGSTNVRGFPGFAVARFDTIGNLDATFGTNGLATTNFGSSVFSSQANGVVIQKDGKIVAAGTAIDVKTWANPRIALARYLQDGSPDTGFGKQGKVLTAFIPGQGVEGNAIVIQRGFLPFAFPLG